MKISADALDRARKVKLIIFDVDGVLTDGRLQIGENGEIFKSFHSRDGFGITAAQSCGIKTAIITGRTSGIINRRVAELKINFAMQGQLNKRNAYKKVKEQFGLTDEEICYIADDVIDLPVFVQVGFKAAVADAAPEVIERAHYVSNNFGGRGAAREVIEFILKAQGLWQEIIERYTTPELDDKISTSLNQ